MGGCEKIPFAGNLKVISMAGLVYEVELIFVLPTTAAAKIVYRFFFSPGKRFMIAGTRRHRKAYTVIVVCLVQCDIVQKL